MKSILRNTLAIAFGLAFLSQPLSALAADNTKVDAKYIDNSSYAVGMFLGKQVESQIDGLINKDKAIFNYNKKQILSGVQDTLKKNGKLTDEDMKKQLDSLSRYLVARESDLAAEKAQTTAEIGRKFRAAFYKEKGVVQTKSTLLYRIEREGKGASPKPTDIVKVHYKGTLPDGTVFDSSYDRKQPVEFQLNQLIPGWVEAIPLMKKGGKMTLVLPPHLGYGSQQAGKIPANSTLKFEIELLDFKPAK